MKKRTKRAITEGVREICIYVPVAAVLATTFTAWVAVPLILMFWVGVTLQ